MRLFIYALTALLVAAGLFLFDDMDIGLPVINLVVWPVVALVGAVILLRNRALRRRSPRGQRRAETDGEALPLTAQPIRPQLDRR